MYLPLFTIIMTPKFLKFSDIIIKFIHVTSAVGICCFLLQSCDKLTQQDSGADSLKTTRLDTVFSRKHVKPRGKSPAWAPDIKPEMLAVIERLISFKDRPITRLTGKEARMNHTATDAFITIAKENNIILPEPMVDTTGKTIAVKGGRIHLRIYTPKTGESRFPVIVYYHGGGFMIGDPDVYDASAVALAEQSDAVVVSVAYRLAPEHKFPTAHEDAYAAYIWTLKNASTIKGNPEMIAVAGESAGGNLAANVSIMARNKRARMPVHQLLIYPIAGSDFYNKSYRKYALAKPLDKQMMSWFMRNYLYGIGQARDPRISLVYANLKGLPPTTIISAGIDPLQSEGELLANRLKTAKVKVNFKRYLGVTHEFFGMAAVVPQAKDAQAYATDELKKAFEK
jgi:acetyl esterase